MINLIPARKVGRCFNGFERDRGVIVHYVEPLPKDCNGDWFEKSLCGTEPGRRGNGWAKSDLPVDCPKCLKKFSAIKAYKVLIAIEPGSISVNIDGERVGLIDPLDHIPAGGLDSYFVTQAKEIVLPLVEKYADLSFEILEI